MQRVYDKHTFKGMGSLCFTLSCYMEVGRSMGVRISQNILFGKVVRIVKIKHNARLRLGANTCVHINNENCKLCSVKKAIDYVLVRYYEML